MERFNNKVNTFRTVPWSLHVLCIYGRIYHCNKSGFRKLFQI